MLRFSPLTAGDRAVISEFVMSDPDHPRICFDREPTPEDADELLSSAAFGAEGPEHELLGAFDDDGTLVGLVEWVCRWPTPATGYIGLLQVRPGHRKQGVATALLERTEQAALAAGCRQLMLSVIARNAPARAFWEHQGFQWLTPHRARRAGPLEAVVMHRPLPAPETSAQTAAGATPHAPPARPTLAAGAPA